MVKDLTSNEFLGDTDLTLIFNHIASEVKKPYNPEWFRPYWAKLMDTGIAKTWHTLGAVLGALFYRDVYTGNEKASVMFFFSLPETRGTGRPILLLDEFEKFAGDREKAIAAHMDSNPDHVRKLYKKRGYRLTEEIWVKA